MSLTARELNQLKKIAAIANQMIAKAEANLAAAAAKAVEPAKAPAQKAAVKKGDAKADTKASKKRAPKAAKTATKEVAPKASKTPAALKKAAAKRTRRTGGELAAFRQMLSDERNNGVSVAELSKQHGVSAAYIYQL